MRKQVQSNPVTDPARTVRLSVGKAIAAKASNPTLPNKIGGPSYDYPSSLATGNGILPASPVTPNKPIMPKLKRGQ